MYMKKNLLLALVAAALCLPAEAENNSLEFCYCGTMGIAPDAPEAGTEVSCAMYIPAEEAAKMKGNSVTGVSVFTGYDNQTYTNTIPEATVWLTYDLGETPFSSTVGPLSDQMTSYNKVMLEKPYTITGDRGFYVGYTVVSPGPNQASIVFDNNDHDNDLGGWYKLGDTPWVNQTDNYGFALIKATIEGASLPQNAVGVFNSTAWGFVFPGKLMENNVQFINMGAAPVESVGVEIKCGDQTPMSGTFPVEGEILYNDLFRLYIDALVSQTGNNVPVTISVTEVNGKPNECAENSVTNYVLCLPEGEGFERNVVMEQGTSLSQGGAPIGIVANREMGSKYGEDKTFIPVMVHLYDDLSAEGYDPFFTSYLCTSIPSIIPNRLRQYANTRAGFDEMEYIYNEVRKMPAFAKMSAAVRQDESDPTLLEVTTATSFLYDCEGEWRLAYVLRRDNVGPYPQANFYSQDYKLLPGQEPFGPMGGFEDEPDPCDIYHENVAVLIENYDGVPGTVPSSVKAGQDYTYTYSLHADDENKLKNTTVLVYLINALNGCIEQAVAVPYSDFNGASVETVESRPAVEIISKDGGISVKGEFECAEIFTVSGIRAASFNASATVALPAGVYIVNVDGRTTKVIVK